MRFRFMRHEYLTHLRAMGADDLEAMLAVQAACYPPSMQEPADIVLARLDTAPGSCLVAVDGAGVCGYLFAYPSLLGMVTPLGAAFDPAREPDTLYLHDLAIAPRAHGRGLARALVSKLLSQNHGQGIAASSLVSVQDTAAFWTALGYCEVALDCPQARAALATYPGTARYMTRTLATRV
ncbi:GNAT family N-acetyltransferase [Massilia sp. G4R7]|uniref:GNAT family N-acetyltransferase n=1 Tax=Massilia phyllostachyos TaxID=2898585 RepID=A0ABS8QBW1_9BURK|nr:GNAT family N-acetyltransferase [Massilia phyllostachyos]MCD2519084.1 GNAT family N-acetyltransferase [Massilia phyllostachyos]